MISFAPHNNSGRQITLLVPLNRWGSWGSGCVKSFTSNPAGNEQHRCWVLSSSNTLSPLPPGFLSILQMKWQQIHYRTVYNTDIGNDLCLQPQDEKYHAANKSEHWGLWKQVGKGKESSLHNYTTGWGLQTFSVKGQIVNILDLVSTRVTSGVCFPWLPR